MRSFKFTADLSNVQLSANPFLWWINISITKRKRTPLSCILFSADQKMWLSWQPQTVESLSWPSSCIMENICWEITDWHKVFGRKYLWEFNLQRFPQPRSQTRPMQIYKTVLFLPTFAARDRKRNTERKHDASFIVSNTTSKELSYFFNIKLFLIKFPPPHTHTKQEHK